MEISTPDQKSHRPAAEWYLLREYVLSEQMIVEEMRDDLAAGYLLQTIRDLGMPLEGLNNIKRNLADFIKANRGQSVSGKPVFPVHIRLFYQTKSSEGKTSLQGLQVPEMKQAIDLTQSKDTSHLSTHGGWGYFLIERCADFTAGSTTYPKDHIDLYLYKEGQ